VIDLRDSEVAEELRATVRDLLAARSPWPAVLARSESTEPYDAKLWRALAAEVGVAGLPVPVPRGGAGATWREAAVVAEEIGRACAPTPFLGSAVVATATLLALDGTDDLLGPLAAGESTAAVVVPFDGGRAPVIVDGGALCGTVRGVADALTAGALLVPAGDGVHHVDPAAAGVARTPVVSLDPTRPLCDITLAGAAAVPLGAVCAVDAGLRAGAVLLAAELLGIAQWCLDATVAYVTQRHQFGRPVGGFQAVKHRLADVWVEVAQARAVARYAAACLAAGDADLPVAAALAKAHCAETAVRAAEECVQLHGGIGFTWEHPATLALKRAKAGAIGFGTPDRQRATLATLVDLPPA
jgi:alkylation response protein AidB-like acyl-CoA dehydrogenase